MSHLLCVFSSSTIALSRRRAIFASLGLPRPLWALVGDEFALLLNVMFSSTASPLITQYPPEAICRDIGRVTFEFRL